MLRASNVVCAAFLSLSTLAGCSTGDAAGPSFTSTTFGTSPGSSSTTMDTAASETSDTDDTAASTDSMASGDGDVTGDGDGDGGSTTSTSGDGDGDTGMTSSSTSGDGDGDTGTSTSSTTGDGDGDGDTGTTTSSTTGDGDGDSGGCTPMGCTSDDAPNGNTCGNAKIVGRTDALAGANYNGDTTGDGNNDDLGTNTTACWDAKYDNFYRIYLYDGDQLTANLDIQDNDFNGMMKIYEGSVCEDGGDAYTCYNNGGDGSDEVANYTATGEGWRTLVVDGRMAFNDDYDWGAYALSITVTPGAGDCPCP